MVTGTDFYLKICITTGNLLHLMKTRLTIIGSKISGLIDKKKCPHFFDLYKCSWVARSDFQKFQFSQQILEQAFNKYEKSLVLIHIL